MNFANINRYALLVHVQSALFLDTKEYQYFTATDLTIDRGIFSRGNTVKQPLSNATSDSIPSVTIVQNTDGIVVSCTCAHDGNKLCEHAAQALFCVMESTLYRPFFDHVTRHRLMLPSAKKIWSRSRVKLGCIFLLNMGNRTNHNQSKHQRIASNRLPSIQANIACTEGGTSSLLYPAIDPCNWATPLL